MSDDNIQSDDNVQSDDSAQYEDPILDAISSLVPALLGALTTLSFVARHLHPPHLAEVVSGATENAADVILAKQLDLFSAVEWPEHLMDFSSRLESASKAASSAFLGLEEAKNHPNGVMKAYRALGEYNKALEALYPLIHIFEPVSRFFLNESFINDDSLIEKLKSVDMSRENIGLMHANNMKSERGGFSLYVPEYYDGKTPMPLIVALHGGSGHGRTFLWSWITEARSRGAILICPTSIDSTWSLTGPDQDTDNINRILKFVIEQWNVDQEHLLLTGMSDGGTFTYVSGLPKDSQFTHLAPISASFHPMLLEFIDQSRLQGLPIYLTHGVLDWMFPIDIAETAHQALKAKGADIVYRPIADLSHTYPQEENTKIVDWFLSKT